MCGIAAIFAYNSSAIDSAELLCIRDAMTPRGPDGVGDWYSPDHRVGLAHRRLSIIDLSPSGAQPMQNHDGSLVVTFNGEIYNYRQLRSQLEKKGFRFQSTSDTEVLLHLYADAGPAMVNHLRGMYAFALWDQNKQGLLLARDPMGIKPLYYAHDGKTLRVASQVKALLAGGSIDTAPEPAGHVGFFLWGHVPSPFTLYRNIRGLPAGSTLWIDAHGVSESASFCTVTEILAAAERAHLESPISHLPSSISLSLQESVRHHLIADVPVGVFLSSGLDSTTLTALAAAETGSLRTVTLGFDEFRGTANDETPLAEKVARQYRATHQTIWVTRADFRAHLDRLFNAMDQPSTDGVNTYFVSYAAASTSLKVALSGLGGDELFGGYPAFREIPRAVHAFGPWRHVPLLGRALRVLSAPLLKRMTSPKYAGMFEYGGTYAGAYLLRRSLFMPWELTDFLDPDFVRAGWNQLQPLLRLEETLDGLRNPRLKISTLETCWYMRNQLLRDADWAGMAHSLEIRTPLVDVELLRQLAPLLAGDAPPSKRDMASTPPTPLPAAILERPKTGFSIPVRQWLMGRSLAQTHPGEAERGLRGWAKQVYARFPGSQLVESRSRKLKLESSKFAVSHPPSQSSKSGIGSSKSDASYLQSPISNLPSEFDVGSSKFAVSVPASRILIFRIGQLGDTIVALPAIWAVKKHFPNAPITLLCDRHPGKKYVLASDLFRGTGIFDEFLSYPVSENGNILKPWRMASLLAAIKRRRFDTLIYLAPTSRSPEQILRDRRFFSLAGIREFIGMEGFTVLPPKDNGTPLAEVRPESDLLLKRLFASDLPVAPVDQATMDLVLGDTEAAAVEQWRNTLAPDGARPWVAVAPGSKMPAKRWPLHRFESVIQQLIARFDIWPVVFGGSEDQQIGDRLIRVWGRGYNAAGTLGLRPAIAALKRCAFFLGNDTGTMHMAASVGVRCVAIFSSRDRPGLWYPQGPGHKIFRTAIECEGCGLSECLEKKNQCLDRIDITQVLNACLSFCREQSNRDGEEQRRGARIKD